MAQRADRAMSNRLPTALLVIVGNLLADIVIALIDPRVKLA